MKNIVRVLKLSIVLLFLFTTQVKSQTITASSEYLSWGGAKGNLFDANINTCWVITAPETGWIQIQYAAAAVYNSYTIVGNTETDISNIKRNPSTWTIQGSNDGTTWTILDTQKGITWANKSEVKTFFFANATAYAYYKMNITANAGNSHTQFAELTFLFTPLDATAPTEPTTLLNTVTSATAFTLSWTASSDNIGVTGYDVYNNNVLIGSTLSTSMVISCLPSSINSMTVKAKDFRGNISAASTPLVVTSPALAGKNIYVTKAGSNANLGTLASPYLTIQHAADVAALGDIINVGAGTYREMVDIKTGWVTFQPIAGESVIINGADLLTAWTLEAGSTYKTTMAWDVDATWGTNQVFSDGTMIELARWPDQTSTDIVVPTNALADNVTKSGQVVTITDAAFNEPDGRWTGAKIWINLAHHGVDGMGYTFTVTSTSAHTITVTYPSNYGEPVLGDVPWGLGKDTEYFLFDPTVTGVNATGGVDALLSNGEWWKNGTTLYVKTPNAAAPSATGSAPNVIEAKNRHFAFYSTATNAGYTIKKFTLFGCAITTDYTPNVSPEKIEEAAHDIVIDSITAKYVSHQTKMTGDYQREFCGWTGMVLRGRNNIMRNCSIQYSATSALSVSGFGNKVLNNVIYNTNYMCANSGAVNTGFICEDAEFGNNTIYNTTIMALYFCDARNSNVSVPDVFRIHHNTIYNFMRRSGDSGALDQFGMDLQWARIDHNIIYNTTPVTGTMVHGIYFDFGGANSEGRCTIDHNIIYDVPSPIMISSTKHVNVYNNVLFSNANPLIGGVINANGSLHGIDDKIYNNIMNKEPNVVGNYGYDLAKADVQNNITNASGTVLTTLFVDAAAHDYHLLSTAIAAINQGKSVGIYDDGVIGVPDLGVYEYGGATVADIIAPSAPTLLSAQKIMNRTFTLTWTASTDNSGGFVSYDVYKDGMLFGSTSATSMIITNLTDSTTYAMSVIAKDAAGNASAGASLSVKTLGGINALAEMNLKMAIYPNPVANAMVTIIFSNFFDADKITLSFYNNLGVHVYSTIVNYSTTISLALPQFMGKGMYFMKADNGANSMVEKLVIE